MTQLSTQSHDRPNAIDAESSRSPAEEFAAIATAEGIDLGASRTGTSDGAATGRGVLAAPRA